MGPEGRFPSLLPAPLPPSWTNPGFTLTFALGWDILYWWEKLCSMNAERSSHKKGLPLSLTSFKPLTLYIQNSEASWFKSNTEVLFFSLLLLLKSEARGPLDVVAFQSPSLVLLFRPDTRIPSVVITGLKSSCTIRPHQISVISIKFPKCPSLFKA